MKSTNIKETDLTPHKNQLSVAKLQNSAGGVNLCHCILLHSNRHRNKLCCLSRATILIPWFLMDDLLNVCSLTEMLYALVYCLDMIISIT